MDMYRGFRIIMITRHDGLWLQGFVESVTKRFVCFESRDIGGLKQLVDKFHEQTLVNWKD